VHASQLGRRPQLDTIPSLSHQHANHRSPRRGNEKQKQKGRKKNKRRKKDAKKKQA
jgi:hypothetical protein